MRRPLIPFAIIAVILLTLVATVRPSAATASSDPPPDPPTWVVAHDRAIIGVGSDTTETLFERLAVEHNRALGRAAPLGSWRATGSSTIVPKAGCQPIERPDGSSPGIVALATREVRPDGQPCIDFARSLAPRTVGAPGNSVFLAVARDALTYAHNKTSNVPAGLTVEQLKAIIECRATRWDQVGGTSTDTIQVFLPAIGPGLLGLLRQLGGVSTIGPCVRTVQQDQGTDPVLVSNRNALVFYSTGKYIGQAGYGHSDEHGSLVLGNIDGIPATVFNPATGRVEINVGQVRGVPSAPESFRITEYIVALRDADGAIPPVLSGLFAGPHSWLCTSPTARRAIIDYGFLPLEREACGKAS